MNTGLLIAGGAAALFLFSRQSGGSLLPTGSTAPAGFTSVGSGLYRDSAGALYARNPSTGQMVKAPTGTSPSSAEDLLLRAGISLIPTVGAAVGEALPGIFEGVGDWLSGLWEGQESATTPNAYDQASEWWNTDPTVGLPGVTETTLDDPWATYDWESYFAQENWWDQATYDPVYDPSFDYASWDYTYDLPAYEPEPYPSEYDYAGFWGRRPRRLGRRPLLLNAGQRYTGIYGRRAA
jgi:hypothetical protein